MNILIDNLFSGSMVFLIRQTLIYAVPLMIVALAGVYAERSGIINLALEGIMIFGAFVGVLFVRLVQQWGWFEAAYQAENYLALQGFMLLTMVVAAALGALFSMLLAFAAINLKADQTVWIVDPVGLRKVMPLRFHPVVLLRKMRLRDLQTR